MTTPADQPANPAASGGSAGGWPQPSSDDWAVTGAGPAGTASDAWTATEADDWTAAEAGAWDPASENEWTPSQTGAPGTEAAIQAPRAHPARIAVGLASLAAERLRGSTRTDDALAVTVGLMGRTADQSVALVRWASSPPVRAARKGASWASGLPGVKRLRGPVGRAREGVARVAGDARVRGRATVSAGRDDAMAMVRSTVDDGITWAQSQVVPKIIEGALPEIRERVLPVVIEDLAKEPRIRELIMEQSRTVVGAAADELRTSTASADDRVESAFRRMFPGKAEPAAEPPAEPPAAPPAEPPAEPPRAGPVGAEGVPGDEASGTTRGG